MNRQPSSAVLAFALAVSALSGLAAVAEPAATVAPADANRQGDQSVAAKNYSRALDWYRYSASSGNAAAQIEVGYFYQHGIGAPPNYVEAIRWYRMAADQGDPLAENQLGYMFEHGLGVTQDCSQAVRWFELSAGQGWPAAKYNLSTLAAHSDCSLAFLQEARGWLIDQEAEQPNQPPAPAPRPPPPPPRLVP